MEFCVSRVSRARCTSRRSAFVSRGRVLLLLFNTTRAHTPVPQAQETLSQWTEVWPTQPVYTQAVNRQNVGEEETPSEHLRSFGAPHPPPSVTHEYQ